MERYTIYCTAVQTEKAIKLGAPIIKAETRHDLYNNTYCFINDIEPAVIIPTAEQMICWLEKQGIATDIHTYFSADDSKIHHYQYTVTDLVRVFNGEYSTRKEATIAAIDAALEYLETLK